MDYQTFIQSADALLFSVDFAELNQAIAFKEPNFWHILGISRRETLISSFLAWLLNPKADHTLGDKFLKEFLIAALRKESAQKNSLTPVHIKLDDYNEVDVSTEEWLGRRRCDIWLESETLGFVCAIENKVGAKESPDQTKDYYQASLEKYPLQQYPHRVYVFLSPSGDHPNCDQFIALSYQDILDTLDIVQKNHQPGLTETFLIQQFTDNILRGIVMDKKVLDLAQSLYDQHHELFEFVFENVERKETDALEVLERGGWDGKSWFFNVGEMANSGYRWEDCYAHAFLCAGGAPRYRKLMERFQVGDMLYAYISGRGYVGVGRVTKKANPFRNALDKNGVALQSLPLVGQYNAGDDDDICDWIVLVDWQLAVPKESACPGVLITPATTGRIYDQRMNLVKRAVESLEQRSSQQRN
jgi:hypothetical protein